VYHLTEARVYANNLGRILHPGHASRNYSSNSRKAHPLAEAAQRRATQIQWE